MADSRPPFPLRHKFALLGIVGGVMVFLPLSQALRYQGAELQAVLAERAALDPMAEAVTLQHALVAHRPLAHKVLAGRPQFEPLRKLRQGEVDGQLVALDQALVAGAWTRALEESHALAADWSVLAGQVRARSIGAQQSDEAHRLRIEQTLQVIDLLVLALAPPGPAGDVQPSALATLRLMPRLLRQTAALQAARDAAAEGGSDDAAALAGAAAAALRHELAVLDATLAGQADPALAAAAAELAAQAGRWLAQSPAPGALPARVPGALAGNDGAPFLHAQHLLFEQARRHSAAALDKRADTLVVRRAALLAALAVLAALAAWLLHHARRAAPPATPTGAPAAPLTRTAPERPEPNAGAESGPVAGRLLRRLRGPAARADEAGTESKAVPNGDTRRGG